MVALKFGAVGIVNSLLGYAVILLALSLNVGDFAANALGYAVGLVISYFLNRSWAFSVQTPGDGDELARFLVVALLSYGVNLCILLAARMNGIVDHPASHLVAMAGYSLTFYFLSRHFVFRAQQSFGQGVIQGRFRRHLPEAIFLPGVVIAAVALADIKLSHDVVWQFWIARQMLGGAKLYADIWELNPPLWFWSAMPIEYAGEKLGIDPLRILVQAVIALGTISAILLTRLADIQSPSRRLVTLVAIFWLCVITPLFDFGQREQLALLCALPYVALIARRKWGEAVSPTLACAVGLLAAYGFALKHYFVLIPLLLEMWLWFGKAKFYRAVRPETAALALCAALYAIAVAVLAPDFFSRIVPMVRIAYHGYEVPLWMMLILPRNLLWIGALTCLALYGRSDDRRISGLVQALLLAALGFGLAYAIQHKGWNYHALPVTAVLMLALFIRVSADGVRKLARYPLAVIVIGTSIYWGATAGQYINSFSPYTDRLWGSVAKGESAFVFASDPMWYWPAGEERDLVWPSRLYSIWMLPAIGKAEIEGPASPELRKLGVEILKQTSHDLRCNPPALILVERRSSNIVQPESFDVRGFFLRDTDIRSLIAAGYKEEPATEKFHVYRRVGNARPAQIAHCLHIVPTVKSGH